MSTTDLRTVCHELGGGPAESVPVYLRGVLFRWDEPVGSGGDPAAFEFFHVRGLWA